MRGVLVWHFGVVAVLLIRWHHSAANALSSGDVGSEFTYEMLMAEVKERASYLELSSEPRGRLARGSDGPRQNANEGKHYAGVDDGYDAAGGHSVGAVYGADRRYSAGSNNRYANSRYSADSSSDIAASRYHASDDDSFNAGARRSKELYKGFDAPKSGRRGALNEPMQHLGIPSDLDVGMLDGVSDEVLAEVHNAAAIELLEANKYQDAEPHVRKALRHNNRRSELWYNVGVVMSGLKRHHEAEDAYHHALALKEDFPSAHFNLARSLLSLANSVVLSGGLFTSKDARLKNLQTAVGHFTKSIDETTPEKSRADTYKSLEETYYALGDLNASWAAYEKYISLQPNEGLKKRKNDSCEQILAFMEDRLLELPQLSGSLELYPSLPSSVIEDLCKKPKLKGSNFDDMMHSFQKDAFGHVAQDLLPWRKSTVAFLAKYFNVLHQKGSFYKDSKNDPRALLSAGRWSLDNDRLTVFLSDQLTPLVSKAAGKHMKLGFVKVAIYDEGASLPEHHDQILNEVSISVVLHSTKHGASSVDWPLVLHEAPGVDGIPGKKVELSCPVGAGLIFRGRDFLHWRPCCLSRKEKSIVMLLHYVPATFPEFQCSSLVDVSASSTNPLVYKCTREPVSDTKDGTVENQRKEKGKRQGIDKRSIGTHAGEVEKKLQTDERYMLYNPCATNLDPEYCQSQFNNQVVFLMNALSVAKALRHILVLPPVMWMEHQHAEFQDWFPFEHFYDIEVMKQHFDVIPLEEFVAKFNLNKQQPGSKKLWWYYYPPYIVEDQPHAYAGLFLYSYMNLSFAWKKRMSPFWQVKMAHSGRGEELYSPGEGSRYWTAARLLLGKMRSESTTYHRKVGRSRSGKAGGEEEGMLVQRQEEEMKQWTNLAGSFDLDKDLQPKEDYDEYRSAPGSRPDEVTATNVLVFDFAPAYNFNWDFFNFDWELKRNRRALRFKPSIQKAANDAVSELFHGAPYTAIHLRRDGYSEFCKAEDIRRQLGQGKLRFGFLINPTMCNPDTQEILDSLRVAGPIGDVFIATNEQDPAELASIEKAIEQTFKHKGTRVRHFKSTNVFKGTAPEHRHVVEMLIAAHATTFVGNVVSTLSTMILMERDILGANRNSTFFLGVGDYSQWGGPQLDPEGGWLNLVGASAVQSSTSYGGEAAQAIDGFADSTYVHGHCSHTDTEKSPWWQVDLGGQYKLTKIRITNRGDCCGNRLDGSEVWVASSDAQSHVEGTRCVSDISIPQGETKKFSCNATGEVVWVVIPDKVGHSSTGRVLSLCSFDVAGESEEPQDFALEADDDTCAQQSDSTSCSAKGKSM